MAFKAIKKIIEEIKSKCKARLITQSMVTNGYSITDEVIDFFKQHPLPRIQVTIDGPEEEHNKTRILCNGKGTYHKILANIEKVLLHLPQTHLAIRVNIGKDNQHGYSLLHKELNTRLSGNFSIYPGFLKINDDQQTQLICESMHQKDMITFYDKLEKEGVVKLGYYPFLTPSKGCVATSTGGYVIGPQGELYKCWNDMGIKERIVGYIYSSKLTNPTLFNRYTIDGRWTSDTNCRKCFFTCVYRWLRLATGTE